MTLAQDEITVLHIGAGRYSCTARGHPTYRIWRELSRGFKKYIVLGRSQRKPCSWSDGNIEGVLIGSWTPREAEFLFTQLKAVRVPAAQDAQVIVCQSPPLGGIAALMLAARTGARIMLEFHGYEYFAPARWGSTAWFLQLLTKKVLGRAHLIRVLSPRMGELLLQRYGSHVRCPIRVLPPRVDVELFEERVTQDETLRGPLRVVMVGAVNSNKGQLRLINALSRAPFDIELHLIGDGPDRQRITERPNDPNSRLSVQVHGGLPQDQVAKLLQTMDVFVMYSRTEGTPRAMIEAMAVGLPVVSTDAGLCGDVFTDGEDGFLLGGDPDNEIVDCLQRFAADRELGRRMGMSGRARAQRDYDAAKLFPKYRSLIVETANS